MSLSNTRILPILYSGLSSPDASPPSSYGRLPPHAAFSPPPRFLLDARNHDDDINDDDDHVARDRRWTGTGTDTVGVGHHPFGAYPFPLALADDAPRDVWNRFDSTVPVPDVVVPSFSNMKRDHSELAVVRNDTSTGLPDTTINGLDRTTIVPVTPDGTTNPHRITTITLPHVPTMNGTADPIRTDSLTRAKAGHLPVLEHLLSLEQTRKLSLAVDKRYIYSGSQSDGITVFGRENLRPVKRLEGHRGSVLSLLLLEEKGWLISGGSDGFVRVWDTRTLALKATVTPAYRSSGDIFCLGWDARGVGTLYFGAQSTDVEFITATDIDQTALNGKASSGCGSNRSAKKEDDADGREAPRSMGVKSTLTSQAQRFFASRPASPSIQEGTTDSLRSPAVNGDKTVDDQPRVVEVTVPASNVIASAHYGYVYGMEIVRRSDGGVWLCTGSGDEDVKVWECAIDGGGLKQIAAFTEVGGAVLCLASRDSLLYAGLQGGLIKIWDLETQVCIRTIMIHKSDVMSISMIGGDAYTSGGDGRVLRLDANFDCTASFEAHSGAVFATAVCKGDAEGNMEKSQLITTGHDSFIKVWGIPPQAIAGAPQAGGQSEGDVLLYALARFVSIQTVTGDANREHCRQGAHFLRKFLEQLGAEAKVVPNKLDGKNPVVVATFRGHNPCKRVLFYGHYDVVNTHEKDWKSNPFELSARNGYLYGRGVADDKGPIIAMACAIANLRERRQLHADVVMVIEGEEEGGSPGFGPTMESIKADVGPIDVILLSNSSWITDEDPCIVWGMRGILQAQLDITGAGRDAHSGVDGGVVPEPMLAMISLLHELHDGDKVRMPNFYADVLQVSSEESELYEQISDITGQDKRDLMSKWRAPTFSVANINSSGPAMNTTVIPRSVTANVSFRLVPNQSLEVISAGLEAYCYRAFASLTRKGMRLEVRVTHQARWWLASLENFYFKKLEQSISEVWGRKPLKIREGGSIPTVPFLEALFDAPCVHLPMGQKSSAAHLANERLKLANLRNGKKVMETFLREICGGKAEI